MPEESFHEIVQDARCCVCGNQNSSHFNIAFKRKDFSVLRCKECGFNFIPPYYRKKITYHQYKGSDVYEAIKAGNNWIKIQRHKLRFKLIKKYKKTGSLFDLGAGWGHFMLAGKELGYDVYGIEIAEQPYLFCKNELNLPVDHIDFFSMPNDKKFDIITMWDVLEHIDRADLFIEKCSQLQNSGSILVIQVPQIDSYIAKKHQENWKMMGLDHVNYFSPKTISKLLSNYGYEILRVKSSFEIKLFIMYTVLPFIKRFKSKKKMTQLEANYSLKQSERQHYFNKFTAKPLWQLKIFVFFHNLLYNLLSFLNIGEEMIVVAKKVK